jgi:hypothetical protein
MLGVKEVLFMTGRILVLLFLVLGFDMCGGTTFVELFNAIALSASLLFMSRRLSK